MTHNIWPIRWSQNCNHSNIRFVTYLHFSLHSRSAASHSKSWFSDSIKYWAHLLYRCFNTCLKWLWLLNKNRRSFITWPIMSWILVMMLAIQFSFGNQEHVSVLKIFVFLLRYDTFLIFLKFSISLLRLFKEIYFENFPCSNFSSFKIL